MRDMGHMFRAPMHHSRIVLKSSSVHSVEEQGLDSLAELASQNRYNFLASYYNTA